MAYNVRRFMTPREPGGSRAKRCPPPQLSQHINLDYSSGACEVAVVP
jgi:hypothetical protein